MRYIIKKVLMMALTLMVVSLCVFLSFNIIPGDPATRRLGTEATPELIQQVREEMGLNEPLLVRYKDWVVSMVKGDMGTSYSYALPVSSMIADKIPITVTMALMAFALMVIISIPLGLYTAKHAGGVIDRVIVVLNQIVMAIPPFFSGILLSLVFGMILKLFTPGAFVSYKTDMKGFIHYLIFPAIAIALPKASMCIKLLRSSVIEEASKDYTRTAYSRGNSTNGVLYKHVLKNAMIPVITFMGMALADMIAGSIVIEQVFGIPGLSRILMTSISNRDYPVVEAIIMMIAAIVIVTNLLVDIIYRIVDPRIEE
ncbi:MAG: ABC transporter permease [Butyrivibrio sp.]|jgi:ABC-type dipeptide/oligopeptide/nickel transport system permease component|nr:ABC transporter permease [Butyrivibrio sp.]